MAWQNLKEDLEEEFAAESRYSVEIAEHAYKMAYRAALERQHYSFLPPKARASRPAIWRAANPEAARAIQHRYDTSPARKAARAERQRQRRAAKKVSHGHEK